MLVLSRECENEPKGPLKGSHQLDGLFRGHSISHSLPIAPARNGCHEAGAGLDARVVQGVQGTLGVRDTVKVHVSWAGRPANSKNYRPVAQYYLQTGIL